MHRIDQSRLSWGIVTRRSRPPKAYRMPSGHSVGFLNSTFDCQIGSPQRNLRPGVTDFGRATPSVE